MRYRPALDGLRAISVLAVLAYHAGVGILGGGFLGVDAFFVLSGFLITTILLAEYRQWRHIDLVRFYAHRARRLLPAVFAMVTAVSIWAAVASPADKLATIRADGLASLFYVANLRFLLVEESYFDRFGDPSPFRHMWSLAIEEQFYFVFPVLLLLLLRWTGGRRVQLASILAVLAGLSALVMALVFVPGIDPSRAYYGTDTRFQELLIGCLLGVWLSGRSASWRAQSRLGRAGLPAALVLVAGLVLARDTNPLLYRGGFTVFCLAVAAVIAATELAPSGLLARSLSFAPLVRVGVISYGLYLWHWPIFVVLSEQRTGLSGPVLVAVRFAVTFLVAEASYRLIERPLRTGRLPSWVRLPRPALITTGALVAVTALFLGTAAATSNRPSEAGTVVTAAGTKAPTGTQTRVMFVGDSVPWGLTTHFPAAAHPDIVLSTQTQFGCGLMRFQHASGTEEVPTPANCIDGQVVRPEAITSFKPQVTMVFLGMGELYDAHVGGQFLALGSPEHKAWFATELDAIVKPFTDHGNRVALVNVGCYRLPDNNTANNEVANSSERISRLNALIAEYAASHHLPVVDLHGAVCAQGYSETAPGVNRLREDGVHYTPEGSAYVWTFLADQVDHLLTTSTASPTS